MASYAQILSKESKRSFCTAFTLHAQSLAFTVTEALLRIAVGNEISAAVFANTKVRFVSITLIVVVAATFVAAEFLFLGSQRVGQLLAAETADTFNGFVRVLPFPAFARTDGTSVFIGYSSSIGNLFIGESLLVKS